MPVPAMPRMCLLKRIILVVCQKAHQYHEYSSIAKHYKVLDLPNLCHFVFYAYTYMQQFHVLGGIIKIILVYNLPKLSKHLHKEALGL